MAGPFPALAESDLAAKAFPPVLERAGRAAARADTPHATLVKDRIGHRGEGNSRPQPQARINTRTSASKGITRTSASKGIQTITRGEKISTVDRTITARRACHQMIELD